MKQSPQSKGALLHPLSASQLGGRGERKQETQARSKQGGRADNNKNRCRFDYYRRHLKQGSPKKSNITQAKNERTGEGRIIFRRRKALLWGSPLGGRWVAGLMIEGEAKPPIKKGLCFILYRQASWVGGGIARGTRGRVRGG